MTDYSIKFAEKKDIPAIMRFIDLYWKKGHILSKDIGLFEWQYVNNCKVNMVIGTDSQNMIQGILGYIPYDIDNKKDISLSLWKANPGTNYLGIKLLYHLLENEPHREVFCNGINVNTTANLYQRFGFEIEKLSQWYRLAKVEDYEIAEISNKCVPVNCFKSNLKLERVHDFETLEKYATNQLFSKDTIPYKSKNYIKKRYFDHPFYKYLIYGVKGCNNYESVIVFRTQEFGNSKALRCIDYIGKSENIYLLTDEIDYILFETKAEYVDMYEYGLDASLLLQAGWLKVGENENIIPNYFAPYEKRNIDINLSMTNRKMIVFKGDGDQDRPN